MDHTPLLMRRRGGRVAIASVAALSLSIAGCGGWSCRVHHVARAVPGEDEYNTVTRAHIQPSGVTARETTKLALWDYSLVWLTRPPRVGPAPPFETRFHPALFAALATQPHAAFDTLLITFRDPVQIPPFPQAIVPSLNALDDSLRLARARAIVDSLKDVRADSFAVDSTRLAKGLNAQILRSFWLTRTYKIRLPAVLFDTLAFADSAKQIPDFVFIRGLRHGELAPTVCQSEGTPCHARQKIQSDSYVAAQLGEGQMAILDTGVRFSHVLLGRADGEYDCVGDETCVGSDPSDIWPSGGHGTQTSGVLTGDDHLGTDYVGVTRAHVKSYKVYAPGATSANMPQLDAEAAMDAFQIAVEHGSHVVVAEMDADEGPEGELCAAADQAFSAGAVVIAANGNRGNTAGAPGIARRVLGAGAYDLGSDVVITGWSGGETWDGRAKPDIVAPNGTTTADSRADTQMSTFGGTSAAAAYLGGAALLVRNMLRGEKPRVDPGKVNAALILAGRAEHPFTPKEGAGKLELPNDCWQFWGKVRLRHGQTVKIPLKTKDLTGSRIEAAIWWPERSPASGGLGKNTISLEILDPTKTAKDKCEETNTVFQHAAYGFTPGKWKLRLKGVNVPSEPQVVYWAAFVR